MQHKRRKYDFFVSVILKFEEKTVDKKVREESKEGEKQE